MSVFLCLVLSVAAFIIIILVCKWGNFSIIPKGLRLKPPPKYKFPKVSRGEDYKWEAHYSSDESDDEDNSIFFGNSEDSDSDSDSEDSESDSNDSEDSESETETIFF